MSVPTVVERAQPAPSAGTDTRLKPGSGRQAAIVGGFLVAGAIGLIVGSNLAVSLIQSLVTPSTRVVVAARDVSLRSSLGHDDVTLAAVARRDVMPGSYSSLNDFSREGTLVAAVSIVKGQQITRNMLVRQGDDVVGPQPAFLPVPKGFVAVSIPDSHRAGVAGFIQAGDYINVVLSIDPNVLNQNKGGQVTRTVFTNLHVIRTGAASTQAQVSDASQPGQTHNTFSADAQSLTVVLTECDAEFLTWLQLHGRLTYTLPSYKDYHGQDSKPDAACPSPANTPGVGPKDVDARWHLSDLAAGLPDGGFQNDVPGS